MPKIESLFRRFQYIQKFIYGILIKMILYILYSISYTWKSLFVSPVKFRLNEDRLSPNIFFEFNNRSRSTICFKDRKYWKIAELKKTWIHSILYPAAPFWNNELISDMWHVTCVISSIIPVANSLWNQQFNIACK